MRLHRFVAALPGRGIATALAVTLMVAISHPARAAAPPALEGPIPWAENFSSLALDQAVACGLDVEVFAFTHIPYTAQPRTPADEHITEQRLAEVVRAAGMDSNPANSQISREFIRKLLSTRWLVQFEYGGGAEADMGLACLADWFVGQGFQRITKADADRIRREIGL